MILSNRFQKITLSKTARLFFIIASLFGATGVGLGAYASHGLASWATITQIEYFQLAVLYQLLHALFLFVITLLSLILNNRFLLSSQVACVLGIIFFSGSLYLYVLIGTKILGAMTPVGGLWLIIAWLLMALAVLKRK